MVKHSLHWETPSGGSSEAQSVLDVQIAACGIYLINMLYCVDSTMREHYLCNISCGNGEERESLAGGGTN